MISRAGPISLCLVLATTCAAGPRNANPKSRSAAEIPLKVPRAPGARRGQIKNQKLLEVLTWQVTLDRAGFSPGVIDGSPGQKTLMALSAFQEFAGLTVTGAMDD